MAGASPHTCAQRVFAVVHVVLAPSESLTSVKRVRTSQARRFRRLRYHRREGEARRLHRQPHRRLCRLRCLRRHRAEPSRRCFENLHVRQRRARPSPGVQRTAPVDLAHCVCTSATAHAVWQRPAGATPALWCLKALKRTCGKRRDAHVGSTRAGVHEGEPRARRRHPPSPVRWSGVRTLAPVECGGGTVQRE